MKYVFVVKILMLISLCSFSQINNKVWNYIQQYHSIAISEMQRTGIPASITLSQGILESGIGESRLALKGNNHFGIKCHDWKGPSMRHNDDRPNECFRVYSSAYESYIDHSDFLKNRSRYSRLFQYANNDYVNWAKGLKACGYATNPKYADMLIERIEKYYLHIFDKPNWQGLLNTVSLNRQLSMGETIVKTTTTYTAKKQAVENNSIKIYEAPFKEVLPINENIVEKTIEPENEVVALVENNIKAKVAQEPVLAKAKKEVTKVEPEIIDETIVEATFKLNQVNGKAAINYNLPISLLQVSRDYGISIKKLMDYNEVQSNYMFNTDSNIFIQKKQKRYKGKHKKHKVKLGDTLHSIAQKYGLSTKHLTKINKLSENENLKEGIVIKLKGSAKLFIDR